MMTATAAKPRPGATRSGPFLLAPLPALPFLEAHGSTEVIAFLLQSLPLAQAAAEEPAEGPLSLLRFFVTLLPIVVLFYFMIIRPQKKKEQEMKSLIHNLKENDRVVTIGGIYGVVTNVQRDADRLTIRVDEATGTKLRVNMSAVARVLTAEDQDSGGTSGNKT